MRNRRAVFGLLGMLLGWSLGGATEAKAQFPNFTLLANLSAISTAQLNSAIGTLALAGDHRAYMSAAGTGMTGFDLGIEATAFIPPPAFSTAVQALSGSAPPSILLIPKINLHKGLPGGLDIGISVFYWVSNGQPLSTFGGDVKWTFFQRPVLPALAIRASFDLNNLWFATTNTYDLDALISYPLVVIDPYVGIGVSYWNGALSVPVGAGMTISNSTWGWAPRAYAGFPLKMGIFRITGQAEYNFMTNLFTVGGKVSFGWG